MKITDIAKIFLSFECMTHKKLQKLCFYFYAWDIVLNGIENKKINTYFEAWVHGPVSPELYTFYKSFGWDQIAQETTPNIEKYYLDLGSQIFRIYGHLTGDELELLTHEELPWIEARGTLMPYEPSNTRINDNIIYNFYKDELEK